MDTNTTVALPAIGMPFEGGFFAGRFKVGEQLFALVVSPKAEGEHDERQWSKGPGRVKGALSFNDGRANTEAMALAGSGLGQWALGLAIGGHKDWYIPSRDELELVYRNLKPTANENACWRGDNLSSVPQGWSYMPNDPAQTALPDFREGGAEALEADYHWTSTQAAGDSDFAWIQAFTNGSQSLDLKGTRSYARAVRRVPL